MKKFVVLIMLIYSIALTSSCSKETTTPPPPPPTKVVVSTLIYDPATVALKDDTATFVINGTFSFKDASRGVASIRLTTSAGADVTIPVPANNETNGVLTGSVEVLAPGVPGAYTFNTWIVDNEGNNSNKLTGTIQIIIDDSGNSWRFKQMPGAFPYNKIIKLDNKYFAIGKNILASQNTGTWTTAYNPSGNTSLPSLYGIAKSSSLYVAVGENKTIVTSPDGIVWTERSSGDVSDYRLYSIVWTGTKFIAVGWDINANQSTIVTSIDGITWTRHSFAVAGGVLLGITKSNNQLVAVGKEYVNGIFHPLIITSSLNGIDWFKQPIISNGSILNDLVYTGEKFVAVGIGVTATSIDGTNWVATDNATLNLYGVVYSGNTYVAVGTGIYTSADATTWQQKLGYNNLGNPFRSVAWSGRQYAVVGYPYNLVMSP
jgi:hypothetical protein